MGKVKEKPRGASTYRVAIYTRKSTDEGLEGEFNSLDAQRQAVEAYVVSQRGEGWVALPERYDDGGYSGRNTDRPAFRRLLLDVKEGKVESVAVYKIDRLSRSLADFAKIMDLFEHHGVTFVSVSQQFNTTCSISSCPSHNLSARPSPSARVTRWRRPAGGASGPAANLSWATTCGTKRWS